VEEKNAMLKEDMIIGNFLNAHAIREWVTFKRTVSLHNFIDETTNFSKAEAA